MSRSVNQKRLTFKARQRKGDIEELSFRTGYSESHVSNVLNGRRRNRDIVESAFNLSFNRRRNRQLA